MDKRKLNREALISALVSKSTSCDLVLIWSSSDLVLQVVIGSGTIMGSTIGVEAAGTGTRLGTEPSGVGSNGEGDEEVGPEALTETIGSAE